MPQQTLSKPHGLTLRQHLLSFSHPPGLSHKKMTPLYLAGEDFFFPLTLPLLTPHQAVISSVASGLLSATALHLTGEQLALHILYAFYLGRKSGGRMPDSLHVVPVTCRFKLPDPGWHSPLLLPHATSLPLHVQPYVLPEPQEQPCCDSHQLGFPKEERAYFLLQNGKKIFPAQNLQGFPPFKYIGLLMSSNEYSLGLSKQFSSK